MSSLLSAAAAVSRSGSCFVAKAVRGFQVLRIDGYSLTKTFPAGGIISSHFYVGNRLWHLDCYPNGADRSKDSADHISVYLRLQANRWVTMDRDLVQAQYKFSLVDAAGDPAYERPAETGIFTCSGDPRKDRDLQGLGCGHGEFISREELERRRESLLQDDRLAIRCDVGFVQVEEMHLGRKYKGFPPSVPFYYDRSDNDSHDDDDDKEYIRRFLNDSDDDDDKEYIRRFLVEKQRRHK